LQPEWAEVVVGAAMIDAAAIAIARIRIVLHTPRWFTKQRSPQKEASLIPKEPGMLSIAD